ncbi:MAG: ribosome assembly cofactor RimP [Odoribacter sp.]
MKKEEIELITTPILESKNLFLVDLKISKDNVIEICVDALTGVNIQTCIDVSRKIEEHLNREEEDFELTVSSAGIGYPFKVNGQFQKNLNKMVEVKLKDNSQLSGILKSFNDTHICLEQEVKQNIEGSKKKELVKIEKTIVRIEIKEIKDTVKF